MYRCTRPAVIASDNHIAVCDRHRWVIPEGTRTMKISKARPQTCGYVV